MKTKCLLWLYRKEYAIKIGDLIILQVALRQILFNIWIWDWMQRLIKWSLQISVEHSVPCMSLFLETPLITFRTKGENWVKIK